MAVSLAFFCSRFFVSVFSRVSVLFFVLGKGLFCFRFPKKNGGEGGQEEEVLGVILWPTPVVKRIPLHNTVVNCNHYLTVSPWPLNQPDVTCSISAVDAARQIVTSR